MENENKFAQPMGPFFIVALHTFTRRRGQIFLGPAIKWAAGGVNDTGREKVRLTTDSTKAHRFLKPSADAVAAKLKGWGYFPTVEPAE